MAKTSRETLIALRARRRAFRMASSIGFHHTDEPPQPPTGQTDDPHQETGGDMVGWMLLVWFFVAVVFVIKHLFGLRLF